MEIVPKSTTSRRRPLRSRRYYRGKRMIIRLVGDVATILVLILVLLPVFWLVLTTFKKPVEFLTWPPVLWPKEPTLDNYRAVLDLTFIGKYFANTLIIASASTFFAVIFGSTAAYSLARVKLPFKLNGIVAIWMLLTRMYPAVATAVPYFVLIQNLGLLDTHWALIITYTSFNLPFVVWLMLGFFQGIPIDLERAATMDGCSMWQRFTRIVLPLSAPGLIATTILSFILGWNEFLFAVILTSLDAKTVPVVIAGFITDKGLEWGTMSALGVMLVLPVILLAWTSQRYLVRGLTLGAVKE
ncbi:MAG: carbohydrate ABC transporter permease [bacterium]|nr:carbohydrate ABC transporter permease [bacterium]